MAYQKIYRYTSMIRPLDFKRPQHRVVLSLMLFGALIGALTAWMNGQPAVQVARQAGSFLLIVYGSWALARELDPDNSMSAFVSVAAGILAALTVNLPGVLIVFTTLALVRMVNRSSGKAFGKPDSIITVALTLLVMYATDSPVFGLVAGMAFLLDGSLKEPLRRQWLFAFLCFGGTVVYMVDHHTSIGQLEPPGSLFAWISVLFLLLFALNTVLLKPVRAIAGSGGRSMDTGRVKAGMWIGLFAALQGISRPDEVAILIAVIAGIGVGMAFRKGFKAPAAG